MKLRNTDCNRRFLLLVCGSLVCSLWGAQRSAAQATYHPTVPAQSYDNSFSIALHNMNVWRNDFYNDIIAANASKGSFGRVSGASRITQQEIQNLCKPFPCVGEKPSIMAPPPAQSPAAPPAPPRQYPIAATDFRPVSGRIMPDEISRASQGTAEEKEMLRSLSNQFLDGVESAGLKNNMANSFAFLTGISMQIIIGRELTGTEEDQLRSGFNNSLASSPQFASMPARDKQVLYETAAIAAGMIEFLDEQGKLHGDAKMQSDARTMAKAVLVSVFGVRID